MDILLSLEESFVVMSIPVWNIRRVKNVLYRWSNLNTLTPVVKCNNVKECRTGWYEVRVSEDALLEKEKWKSEGRWTYLHVLNGYKEKYIARLGSHIY